MSTAAWALDGRGDRRASERFSVAVPATLRMESQDYTAKILDIVQGGAMLETSAPLEVNSRVLLRCGTVAVHAIVVWSKADRIGINFETPLTDAQVSEQVSRTTAMAARRDLKLQS